MIAFSAVAAVASQLGGPAPVRGAVVGWFLVVCPGMVVVRRLGARDLLARAVLAVALSLAVDTLVAEVAAVGHWWAPSRLIEILAGGCLLGVAPELVAAGAAASRALMTACRRSSPARVAGADAEADEIAARIRADAIADADRVRRAATEDAERIRRVATETATELVAAAERRAATLVDRPETGAGEPAVPAPPEAAPVDAPVTVLPTSPAQVDPATRLLGAHEALVRASIVVCQVADGLDGGAWIRPRLREAKDEARRAVIVADQALLRLEDELAQPAATGPHLEAVRSVRSRDARGAA